MKTYNEALEQLKKRSLARISSDTVQLRRNRRRNRQRGSIKNYFSEPRRRFQSI